MLNPKYALPISNLVVELAEKMPTYKLAETSIKIEIGRIISEVRREKKLSQEDLAEKMNVSQGLVSRWESGRCNFTINSLAAICEALDLNLRCPIEKNQEAPCVGFDVSRGEQRIKFNSDDNFLLEVAA